ncbi:MAG: glycosyltransferase family 2 protein [Phycisphaerae bacterium]|nr:glycosyltransferase family 2 protein [Phycisphaerae bacterium]
MATGVPRVSVALPVHRDGAVLLRAAACVLGQSVREIELLIILNGSDDATRRAAATIGDPRVRVIELERASLAGALNVALRESRAALVARMDADDECPAHRLARQVMLASERPELAAIGCAWEQRFEGRLIATIRPDTSAARLAWKLLHRNELAHGSMLLRRDAVLAAGGYDERRSRAQDYDLWLRLAGRVGASAEVLYTHHLKHAPGGAYSAGGAQSEHAAQAQVEAWARLPRAAPEDRETLAAIVSRLNLAGAGAMGELEALLDRAASVEALAAWLSAKEQEATARSMVDLTRAALLTLAGQRLRNQGFTSVWLYGAGAHTSWVLGHAGCLDMTIEGVVDDHAAGRELGGFTVNAPDAVPDDACVLLSSEAHEEELWAASAGLRARGARVEKLYQMPSAAPSAARIEAGGGFSGVAASERGQRALIQP